MAEFPPELIFEILLRLPPEDLLRCSCVSKSWNATIHDKSFIKSHLQRSIQTNSFGSLLVTASVNHDGSELKFSNIYNDGTIERAMGIGQSPLQDVEGRNPFPYTLVSSNGIICIRTETPDRVEEIVLWNPSIRKFKKIPSPTFEQPPSSDTYLHRHYGFGYDSANDDYKLLGIAMFFVNWDMNIVVHQYQIYSLKSNSWRKTKYMPRDELHFVLSEIVFSNGALSWQAYNVLDKKSYVVTFELASEKYHWFPNPPNGESVLVQINFRKFVWFDLEKKSWKQLEIGGLHDDVNFTSTICTRSLCLLDGDPISTLAFLYIQLSIAYSRVRSAVKLIEIKTVTTNDMIRWTTALSGRKLWPHKTETLSNA
ncbi:F-box protein CPR30-like [Pyrus ussuriensis x Pyrus communis]|uniref:F-box protein CPR30-like n=1 Tax=Pyrus ussuriensis x Pyrus communis TaxID=2448454 RepID=A0A5N5HHD9_9ROSA|nr:F-box protein CPR30-like [Pyrus ussuriensis x Pyrus communis]